MIFSIGVILTPWDWSFGFHGDEEVSLFVLGPFVIALEDIDEW